MDPSMLTDDERKYYREVWGFDPITDLVDLPKGEKGYQQVFSLDADPPLHAIGMKIIARVVIRSQGDPHNLVVFSMENAEQAVYCTHTIVYQDSAENLEALADDELLARIRQGRGSPVKLPPWEHFASLKSYVAAIAEAGITHILKTSYRSQPDPSHHVPIGFNSAMQAQVFDALFELAPAATESLLMDFLLELGESTPPSWLKSHLPLMHASLQAYHFILKHAQAFRDTKNPVFLELLDATPDLTEDEFRFLHDQVGIAISRASSPAGFDYPRKISFPLKVDLDLHGMGLVAEESSSQKDPQASIYLVKSGNRTENIVKVLNDIRDDESPYFWVSNPEFFHDYLPDLRDLEWYLEKATFFDIKAKVTVFSFAACCLISRFIADRGIHFFLFASQGNIQNYTLFHLALWRVMGGLKAPELDHLRHEFLEELLRSAPEDWLITNWRGICWHFNVSKTLFSTEEAGWYRDLPLPLQKKLLEVVMKVYPDTSPAMLPQPGVEIVPLMEEDEVYGWAHEKSYHFWERTEITVHFEDCEDPANRIWFYDGSSLSRINLMDHNMFFAYLFLDAEQRDEGIPLKVMFDAMCMFAEALSRLNLEGLRAAVTRYGEISKLWETKAQYPVDLLFGCLKAISPQEARVFASRIREGYPRVSTGGDYESFLTYAAIYYPLGHPSDPPLGRLQDLSEVIHDAIMAWKAPGGEGTLARKCEALAGNLTFKGHVYGDLAAFREFCQGLPGPATWALRVDATYFPWANPEVITYLLDDSDPFIRARAALWSPTFPSLFVRGGPYREKDECLLDLEVLARHKDYRVNFIGALRAQKDFSSYFPVFKSDDGDDLDEDNEEGDGRLDDAMDLQRKEYVAVALILNPMTPPELARNAVQYLEDLQYEQGYEFDFPDDLDYVTPEAPISTFDLLSFLVEFPNYTFHCQLVSRGLSNEGMPENSAITFSVTPNFPLHFGWREDGAGLLLRDHGDGTATRYDARMFLLHFLDEQWEVKTHAQEPAALKEPLRGYLTNAIWKGQRKYPYTSRNPFFLSLDEERYTLSKPDGAENAGFDDE